MSFRNGLGLGVLGLALFVGCGGYVPDEAVRESTQHIELHDLGSSYGFAFVPSAPLQSGEALTALQARLTRHSFPIQATGAIIAPDLDASGVPITQFGSAVRFTCGATLVSPSYVITAAHCVDSDSIKVATDTVVLEMYRPTSKLALDATWRPKTTLTGTFPDFQHGTYSADDGYLVDHYACTLSARCGSGSVNCPNDAAAIDVALLHCAGRPGDRYGYLNVASSERAGVDVYTPWKHEVYDIAASELTTSDKYLHYVKYPATYPDNYHYLDRNQLLPLETIAWPNGAQPRKVSDTTQLTVWTDALGCHGTSGSGFLQQNPSSGAWELLGPTALAGSAFGTLLCEHLPGIAPQSTPVPGQQNIAYSSVGQTQTVLSGSTAAWAADCAAQPLGFFSLGGRSACTRAQAGLPFSDRVAYGDLDPWRSPTLQVGAATTQAGAVQLETGKSYRVALGVTPAAGCTTGASGSVCPEVVIRVGTTEVLRATLQASAGQTALVGALFTATSSGSQPVTVLTPAGSFELGALEIVANAGTNSFDTGYERAEVALVVPSVDPQKALPMRFVGDGLQGFAGLLFPGERLLLAREALALQGTFSVRFTSASAGALSCGLVDKSGAVLASSPCSPGVSTDLSYVGGTPAAAFFIEGAPAAGVEIDNLSVSMSQLATSHCNDGLTDAGESDVDCGGTCVRCADSKNCLTPADCASNVCTAGKCVAAPTCSDALKNGTETDVDCGGSCATHCAVGKSCGVAADCSSNLCTAGKCVAAPTCSDALKNGTETDVDCGGSCATHCAVGKSCGVAADCSSNLCTAGKCVAGTPAAVVATLSLSSQWDVGYCAAITVTNKSTANIQSWTAVVNLAQSSVSSSWSATVSTSGSSLTARSLSWNGQLAPNASTSWGYCATKTGSSWQPSVVSASSP